MKINPMRDALLCLLTSLIAVVALAQPPKPSPSVAKQIVALAEDAMAILSKNCFPCHSGEKPSGGLDLSSRAALLRGGFSGSAVTKATPDKSLLLKAVRYEGRQMPPQGKLPQAHIEILTRWVAAGSPWAKTAPVAPNAHGVPDVATGKKHWAFRPVIQAPVPTVKNRAWVRDPMDAFILAKLEQNGLQPAPPASRAALIRRAYFDMLGLPPTPDEVRAFLNDRSPRAWETVVDRLLASPHYGERWGRHWLDLVRYAETNSLERDGDKPFVWRYRDYVIRSFHEDKPYNRFLLEQIAGDELPDATPETQIATGFYRLGSWDDEPSDPPQAFYDDLDDVLSTMGQTVLGLTIGCARCHDHKIDPIPQRDYYQMLAFVRNIRRYGERSHESVLAASVRPISPEAEQRRFASEMTVFQNRRQELEQKIKVIEDKVTPDFASVEKEDFKYEQNRLLIVKRRVPSLLSSEEYDSYTALLTERRELLAHPPRGLEMALCVTEPGPTVPATHVLTRGSAAAPAAEVTPAFLSVLSPPRPQIAPTKETSGRRLALAKWLASEKNPLTARVMVNRLWHYHFGRGIVRSTSNFGLMGTAPTHPELLDYLASELMWDGWRLKPLHRRILLSATYRMSAQTNPVALKKDPENDFSWRFDLRRLEAEEVRDAILTANGTLNRAMYGPSVKVKLPREVLLGQSVPGQGWDLSSPEEQARRSVYIKIKRSLAVPMLARFDAADTDATCPVRFVTTQPTQALGMLNSEFVNEQAKILATFARKSVGEDAVKQVRFVFWRVVQREPSAQEIERGVQLIEDLKRGGLSAEESLTAFCLMAYNLNEFIYLD